MIDENEKITPIILSGGQVKRLWPVSTAKKPKQYISFWGNKSSFEKTIERVRSNSFADPAVICSARHKAQVDGFLKTKKYGMVTSLWTGRGAGNDV